MPIYEFHCAKCDRDSELLLRNSNWEGTACPHCGSEHLEKKLSVFAPSGPDQSSDLPPCSGNPSGCGRCSLPEN